MSLNPVEIVLGAGRGALAEVLEGFLTPSQAATVATHVEERVREQPAVRAVEEAAAPIPWWRSEVIIGALASIIAPLVAYLLKTTVSPSDVTAIAEAVLNAIGGLGSLWIIVARVRSRAQPVTVKRT